MIHRQVLENLNVPRQRSRHFHNELHLEPAGNGAATGSRSCRAAGRHLFGIVIEQGEGHKSDPISSFDERTDVGPVQFFPVSSGDESHSMTRKTDAFAVYLCADDRLPVFMMFGTVTMFKQLVRGFGISNEHGYLSTGTKLMAIPADEASSVDLTALGCIKEPILVHNFAS